MQKILGPLRARERPLVLGAQLELLTRPADVERDLRLLVPAGVLAFEEMAEEALLELLAIVAVEVGEVGVSVHFEPLLFRARAQVTLEVAARVQALPAPVSRG